MQLWIQHAGKAEKVLKTINKIRLRRVYAWTGREILSEFGGSKRSRTNPGQTTEHGGHTARRVSQAEKGTQPRETHRRARSKGTLARGTPTHRATVTECLPHGEAQGRQWEERARKPRDCELE